MPPKRKRLAEQSTPRDIRTRPVLQRKAKGGDHGEDKNQKASLMTLPAELRVAIYEYALVDADGIIITAALKQPELLSTCRQIRNEAMGIWYHQNLFDFEVTDCDASLIAKFEDHVSEVGIDHAKMHVMIWVDQNSRKSWRNLMMWCERLCSTSSWFPASKSEATDKAYLELVVAACEIANQYYETGASWALCRQTLGHLRKAVGALDAAWSVDE